MRCAFTGFGIGLCILVSVGKAVYVVWKARDHCSNSVRRSWILDSNCPKTLNLVPQGYSHNFLQRGCSRKSAQKPGL